MTHPRACFEAAVTELIADGTIKRRLKRAFENHLEGVQEADLPTELRDSFSQLNTALHRVKPMGEQSCIRSTVQKMSPAEATSHARTITRMYFELTVLGDRAEPLKVVESAPSSAPRFLTSTS
jgi:hypothetical protein